MRCLHMTDHHPSSALRHFVLFPFQYFFFFLGLFLCLRSAGLPGDGGWYELKCNVAMASVTLGDCKQGLHWRWEEAGWWGGRTSHLVLGEETYRSAPKNKRQL